MTLSLPDRILALDPGTRETGWALIDTDTEAVVASGKDPNERVRSMVGAGWAQDPSGPLGLVFGRVVIEVMDRIFGPSDATVIETLIWTGRFIEACCCTVERIARKAVLTQLFGKVIPKPDPAVTRLLTDRYAAAAGDPLGGRRAAVGVKAAPGPLYGVRADAWQAIAVGLAWIELERERVAAAAMQQQATLAGVGT